MGAEQSSTRGGAAAAAATDGGNKKEDYYHLLGVDRQASDEEIKKAYRKKALELHPDRNFGDVENATRKFAEVQSAYEVLSDPQERAWYDSHRDAILRGDDPTETEAAPQYHDVRLFTADDIYTLIGRFNKNVPLDDSPNSFFTILQDSFDRLAQGEKAASDWDGLPPIQYPPFGSSKDDDKVAKAFYNRWMSFSTRLNFSWKDKWRLSDAPDRRIRRLMEKENKKSRDDAIREFNDAVRSLVVFVRKRDPRHVPNTQTEAERQKILRESAAAQAARARAAHQEKTGDAFNVPEWARSRGDETYPDEFSESEEESEVEHIECVVCNKIFKSEKQYEAHEKSKKHIKAVQQIKRQMKKESASLHLDNTMHSASASPPAPVEQDDGVEDDGDTNNTRNDQKDATQAGEPSYPETDSVPTTLNPDVVDSEVESEDDDYASRDAVEARLASSQNDKSNPLLGDDQIEINQMESGVADISLEGGAPTKKVGKAKAKREKKAARQAAQEQGEPIQKCTTCNSVFDSKNKLFKHLSESGHADLKVNTAKSNKKKKR
ncbi:DnaJ-domain-containing protein [Biscogniauxia sp. FL1348]|nr:DnaJ-domain-containing protein [Biscogniauxia sp. FL1348]